MDENLPILSAQLTGTPLPESWSQTVSFLVTADDETAKAHVWLVVQISRADNEDGAFFGRTLITALEDICKKEAGTSYARLSHMLTKAHELAEGEKAGLNSLSVIAALIEDRKLYVGGIGSARAVLMRGGTVFSLDVVSVKDHIISGVLEKEDYIILGTESFFEHAYPTSHLFDGKNSPQDIADTLLPLLLSLPQNAEIAGTILRVGADEKTTHEVAAALPTHTEEKALPFEPEPMSALAESIPQTHGQEQKNPDLPSTSQGHPLLDAESQAKPPTTARKLSQKMRPFLYIFQQKEGTDSDVSSQRLSMGSLLHKPAAAIRSRKHLSKILLVLLILAVLLLISVLVRRVWQSHQRAQANQLYATAMSDVEQAQSIKSSNPQQALQLLTQAKSLVTKAQSASSSVTEPPGLVDSINQSLQSVDAITAVKKPKVVFDLSLVKQGFTGSRLDLSKPAMIAVDAQTPTVLRLSPDSNTSAIATGGTKIPNFIGAALNGNTITALTQDGVYTIDDTTGQANQVIAKDTNWGTISSLATYLGNVYLLDAGKSQIWKYPSSGTGFSAIKNILTSQQDFSGADDLVVDGSLWFVKGNNIIRVTGSDVNNFTIAKLDKPLGSHLRISTGTPNGNLYILDKDNKRIVAAGKDGTYVGQYQADSFGEVQDIAVDDSAKIIYLLTKDKVEQIPITQ